MVMILNFALALYAFALVSVLILATIAQSRLLELFKKKKRPQYPITFKDAYNYTKKNGYNPTKSVNFALFPKRLEIIRSSYPEDPELNYLARKVRSLFALGVIIMVIGFALLIAYAFTRQPIS